MKKLQRDAKIKMNLVDDNKWEIKDVDGKMLVDGDSDYLIYMKNVNFRKGNVMEGRFLGVIEENSPLLNVGNSTIVTTDGEKFSTNGEQVRSAKMVVVNNKTNVVIVISNGR